MESLPVTRSEDETKDGEAVIAGVDLLSDLCSIGDTVESLEKIGDRPQFRETLKTVQSVAYANYLILHGKWRKIAAAEK
jgi:hypothetical protein